MKKAIWISQIFRITSAFTNSTNVNKPANSMANRGHILIFRSTAIATVRARLGKNLNIQGKVKKTGWALK